MARGEEESLDDPEDLDSAWLAQHGFDEPEEVHPEDRAFAGYQLQGELGRGGMGVVYAAVQSEIDRRVALKILSPSVSGLRTDARRFRNEVEAASRLDHPNILPVYEFGEHEGQWFYTMKLAEGGTLAKRESEVWGRESEGAIAAKERQRRIAVRMRDLAEAVAYAHQRGILHRDLKPANILLDHDGTVYVSDFGLAKFLEEDRGLTLTQGIVGTPGYMAPEQAGGRNSEVTTATDVYGLGAILYELLTGRAPFDGDSTVEVLRQVVEQEVEPPRRVHPRIDRDLETICLKCLSKEPSRRYPTAEALAADLGRWIEGEIITARPASGAERAWRWCRRRPALAALSVTVAILAITSTITAIRMGLAVRAQERESYYANISLAYDHIEDGDIKKAVGLLLQCPEDMRHWEWGHLMFLCHQSIAFIPSHTNTMSLVDARYAFEATSLRGLEFSPDGEHFVTLLPDGRLRIWEIENYSEVLVAGDAANPVHGFAFSRDGRYLAMSGKDRVKILERHPPPERMARSSESGRAKLPLSPTSKDGFAGASPYRGEKQVPGTNGWHLGQSAPTGDQTATSLSWGRLGEQDLLAAGFPDGTVRVWNISSQGNDERVRIVLPGTNAVSFTTDSTRLAIQVKPKVFLVDPLSGENIDTIDPAPSHGTEIRLGPRARRWVTVDAEFRVKLWHSANSSRYLGEARAIAGHVFRCVVFSPDGRRFCTGGEFGYARVWDAETGAEIFSIPVRVSQAAFSPDGRRLITAGNKMEAYVWDVDKARKIRMLAGHREIVDRVAFSPDGQLVLTASRDGTVGVWRSDQGRDLLDGDSWPYGATYNPDGALCCVMPCGRGLWIWDAETGARRLQLAAERDNFWNVAFSYDGAQVATDSMLREPRVWDLRTGRLLHTLRGHERAVYGVVYSPKEPKIATADWGGGVRLWDARTGNELHVLEAHSGGFGAIAFSPCGQFLASGAAEDETVRVWSVASGECLHELDGHSVGCTALQFLPTGNRLATAALDQSIRFWNVEREEVERRFELRGCSYRFDFSPDGRRLVTWTYKVPWVGFDFPSLEIWDVEEGRTVLSLRGHTQIGTDAAFSEDGRRLISCAGDFTTRQWESFPWVAGDYAAERGSSLRERIRSYAQAYWRQRLREERTGGREVNPPLMNHVAFDRSKIPPRSAEASPAQLDLTPYYGAPLGLPFYPTFFDDYDHDLGEISPGLHEFDGLRFDVRGVLQLRPFVPEINMQGFLWNQLPLAAHTIPVRSRVERLHLLHGTAYGTFGNAEDGSVTATLRWHYADGTERETEIVYGVHVRDWMVNRDSGSTPEGLVAWQGSNPTAKEMGTEVRIYQSSFENPRPAVSVESLDIESRLTPSAPFVLAVTVE